MTRQRIMTVATVLFLQAALTLNAQTPIAPPDDTIFTVRVDFDRLRDTPLGGKLIELAQALAAEEIGAEETAEGIEEMEKALGFNPFDDLRSLVVFGSDLEEPLEGLRMVVDVRETTGNLEGLLLALPGYDASKHGEYTIHSIEPEDDLNVFGAIHGAEGEDKRVLVARQRDDLTALLDSLGKRSSRSSRRYSGEKGAFVRVEVDKFPSVDGLEGPPAAIAKLLKRLTVDILQDGDDYAIDLALTTEEDKQAEQLEQLAQGMVAMVGLAQSVEEDDEDLEIVAELLKGLEVSRQDRRVRLELKLPQEFVMEFLREEAGLEL